jgi:mRNA interferase RelE/StbE
MVLCRYKKTFLKDLTKVHPNYRERIETLVFEKVPASENAFAEFDIRKIKGYQDFYRIRVGVYRIGCRIQDGVLIFYRVKSREEIYGVFP